MANSPPQSLSELFKRLQNFSAHKEWIIIGETLDTQASGGNAQIISIENLTDLQIITAIKKASEMLNLGIREDSLNPVFVCLVVRTDNWSVISEIGLDPINAVAFVGEIALPDIAPDEGPDWPGSMLFDRGFLPVFVSPSLLLYVRSRILKEIKISGYESRGIARMNSLGQNGRFGNEIFQYLFMKMYALRNGLRLELPNFPAQKFFQLFESEITSEALPEINFFAFDNDDLELWNIEHPPRYVNFRGYFQEIPGCWKAHRSYIQRLMRFSPACEKKLAELRASIASNNPLIVAHIRRGDYLTADHTILPWYRPIPIEWTVRAIERIKHRMPDAQVYIASDDLDEVLPYFSHLDVICNQSALVSALNDPLLIDFYIMREASVLLVANSSFSRSAALLGSANQECLLPDFAEQDYKIYKPWDDSGFWVRFGDGSKKLPYAGYGLNYSMRRSNYLKQELGGVNLYVSQLENKVMHLKRKLKKKSIKRRIRRMMAKISPF